MSNLVKAIAATDTGERAYIKQKTSKLFQDVFNVREDMQTTYTPDIATIYKIGVTLGNQVMVPEFAKLQNENALTLAIERTKEQIIEAVFGEFRQDFRLIEKLLYDYDFEGAATALRAMEQKMYTTE